VLQIVLGSRDAKFYLFLKVKHTLYLLMTHLMHQIATLACRKLEQVMNHLIRNRVQVRAKPRTLDSSGANNPPLFNLT
jgi:hypothetical protein